MGRGFQISLLSFGDDPLKPPRFACPSKPELPPDRPVSPKIIARQEIIPRGGGVLNRASRDARVVESSKSLANRRRREILSNLGKLVQQRRDITVVDILLDEGLVLQGGHSESQLILESRYLHFEEDADRYLVAPLERFH